MKIAKKITIKSSIILFLVLLFAVNAFDLNLINNLGELNNPAEIHTSAEESFQEQWISNPNFISSDNWTSVKGGLGDPNDINAYIGGGSANYEVLGYTDTFSVVADPPQSSNWRKTLNPEYPAYPDDSGINSEGCWVQHQFREVASDQLASAHWEHEVEMPVNMSDYEIKTASLTAVFNGTADANIECPGDYTEYHTTYDWARFYVLLSNEDNVTYEVASYQVNDLGVGSYNGDTTGPTRYKSDTNMITVPESSLKTFLTSILTYDYTHFNITLGIKVWCEDNHAIDRDDWDYLLIKRFNLTFTYEKKINQLTSISYNQDGKKISEDISISNYTSFEVTQAILNFEYKVNDTWPSSSPNSEIRIIMNNIIHTETVKLSTATMNFENASQDGFDLTSLISDDVNLSIQVFLADNFELDKGIAVSIDNVILNISYTVFFADYQTNLQLFLNGVDQTSITLHEGQMLNITVKYTNQTGGHISGADIQLTGDVITALNETTNQYTTILNVSEELSLEEWNDLNIEATKQNYKTRNIGANVYVRKLWGEIQTYSGNETFVISSGAAFQLRIRLNDTDNNEWIEGAIVQYTLSGDPIPRVLTEDNGVYEGLVLYEGGNLPDGLYTITIKVVGGVGDDYDFEHFHPPDGEYTITLNVGGVVPSPEPSTDLSWLISLLIYVFSGVILGVALLFTLYIKIWRYPPLVRKIRGLKKKVSKAKKTKPVMVDTREEIIKNNLQDSLKILSLELTQPEKIDKIEKFDIKKEEVN